MVNYYDIAIAYHHAGLRVIPVNSDKRPTGKWAQYRESQTEADIWELFKADCWGIAILTGVAGLEVVDIDSKHDISGDLAKKFLLSAESVSGLKVPVAKLPIQATMNGGYHLFYRCPNPDGNKKLATRPPTESEEPHTNPVLIETRGVGGYVVAYPSPGYAMELNSLLTIPAISQPERDAIIAAAKSFDEMPDIEPIIIPRSTIPEQRADDVTPWDDFNDRESPVDLLQKYGWEVVFRQGERVFLKRPGKTDAKTSGNYHEGKKLFVCHSTSTPLPTEKGLTAWSIYKYYKHSGDASAAAKALYSAGYGSRHERQVEVPFVQKSAEEIKQEADKLMEAVWKTRYVYGPIKKDEATFTHTNPDSGKIYNIGGDGMLGVITGKKKSGKTFVMLHLVAAAISTKKMMGFRLHLRPDQNILFVDTEQSRFFFEVTQHEVYDMASVTAPANYYAFHLRKWSVAERLTALRKLIEQIPNLGLIVIDGVVDLCADMMDYDKSTKTVQELMKICEETGAMVLTVLHLTKQGGDMRGHLGTELGNKCDFSMSVEKAEEERIFTVKSLDSRFAQFAPFSFKRDEESGSLIYFEKEEPAPW